MSQASIDKFHQHLSNHSNSMDSDILASYGLQRLKHESRSQWKERILSIEKVNSIKEDNTITVATSFEKADRKAKRQRAKEGKKKKGSKSKTSAFNMHRNVNEKQHQNAAMATPLKVRLAAYQRQVTDHTDTVDEDKDDNDKEVDDGTTREKKQKEDKQTIDVLRGDVEAWARYYKNAQAQRTKLSSKGAASSSIILQGKVSKVKDDGAESKSPKHDRLAIVAHIDYGEDDKKNIFQNCAPAANTSYTAQATKSKSIISSKGTVLHIDQRQKNKIGKTSSQRLGASSLKDKYQQQLEADKVGNKKKAIPLWSAKQDVDDRDYLIKQGLESAKSSKEVGGGGGDDNGTALFTSTASTKDKRRRDELRKIMKDKTLSKKEKSLKMAEVRAKYEEGGLVEEGSSSSSPFKRKLAATGTTTLYSRGSSKYSVSGTGSVSSFSYNTGATGEEGSSSPPEPPMLMRTEPSAEEDNEEEEPPPTIPKSSPTTEKDEEEMKLKNKVDIWFEQHREKRAAAVAAKERAKVQAKRDKAADREDDVKK